MGACVQTNQRGPGLDRPFQAGFPEVLQLPYAARAGFTAHGLHMPWYSAYGNHDGLMQDNLPIGFELFGLDVSDIAVGDFKSSLILGIPDKYPDNASDWFDLAEAGIFHDMSGVQVPADPAAAPAQPLRVHPAAFQYDRHAERSRIHVGQ